MQVSIDQHKCTGHGLCYLTAPDVFTDDDLGYGRVIDEAGQVAPEHQQQARQGAENCPERAIDLA